MTNNPYESPLDPHLSRPSANERPAPLRFVGIGALAGSILGGTFGAGHAAIVAVTAIILQVYGDATFALPAGVMLEYTMVFLLAAMFAGALIGMPVGLAIGVILGVSAGVSGPQARRPFCLAGITITSFAGAIGSGVFAYQGRLMPQAAFAFYAIVLSSGTLAGFLCGICLVRGLAKLAWPQSVPDERPKGIDPRL